jgi:hypothetical protein
MLMSLFPNTPLPSSVSAPAIIDEMHTFSTDSGVVIRRPKHSRPRRRFTLEYLGKNVAELRTVRDFLQACRLGALPFEWLHPTAGDLVNIDDTTTPVIVYYTHGLVTGQYIYMQGGPTHLTGVWQVTKLNGNALALNGSIAGGPVAQGYAYVYLPNAVGVFASDTWDSPTTLIGPEQWYPQGGYGINRVGVYNFNVVIEEIF